MSGIFAAVAGVLVLLLIYAVARAENALISAQIETSNQRWHDLRAWKRILADAEPGSTQQDVAAEMVAILTADGGDRLPMERVRG